MLLYKIKYCKGRNDYMKKHGILEIVLHWLCVAIFIGGGIAVLILRHMNPTYEPKMLGVLILVAGIVKVLAYLLFYLRKNPRSVVVISGVSFVILGTLFLVDKYDFEALCLAWGLLDITLGIVEIFTSIFELKEDKLQIFEILVALGGLVFGVLLTIELAHGLTAHIIYLGISLILLACILIAEFIIHKVKGHKE